MISQEMVRIVNRRLSALFGDAKDEIVFVMKKYIVIRYHDFLSVRRLKPVVQHIAEGQQVILLRNRDMSSTIRVVSRIVKQETKKSEVS